MIEVEPITKEELLFLPKQNDIYHNELSELLYEQLTGELSKGHIPVPEDINDLLDMKSQMQILLTFHMHHFYKCMKMDRDMYISGLASHFVKILYRRPNLVRGYILGALMADKPETLESYLGSNVVEVLRLDEVKLPENVISIGRLYLLGRHFASETIELTNGVAANVQRAVSEIARALKLTGGGTYYMRPVAAKELFKSEL